MDIPADSILQFIDVAACLLKDSLKDRIIHLFRNPYFLRVNLHDSVKIHHHVREHFNTSLLLRPLNPNKRNRRILNPICHLPSHLRSCLGNDLPRNRACHILRKHLPGDTVLEGKLLIELIPSHLRQVIASRIKEHTGNQTLCAVHRQRLTRTDLLIQFQKTFLVIRRGVLLETCHNLRFFTEQLGNLRISPDSQRAD